MLLDDERRELRLLLGDGLRAPHRFGSLLGVSFSPVRGELRGSRPRSISARHESGQPDFFLAFLAALTARTSSSLVIFEVTSSLSRFALSRRSALVIESSPCRSR